MLFLLDFIAVLEPEICFKSHFISLNKLVSILFPNNSIPYLSILLQDNKHSINKAKRDSNLEFNLLNSKKVGLFFFFVLLFSFISKYSL